jgi:hypothetical protein
MITFDIPLNKSDKFKLNVHIFDGKLLKSGDLSITKATNEFITSIKTIKTLSIVIVIHS